MRVRPGSHPRRRPSMSGSSEELQPQSLRGHRMPLRRTLLTILCASFSALACGSSGPERRAGGHNEPGGMQTVGPGVNPTQSLPPLRPVEDAWGQTHFPGQLQWPESQGPQNLTVVNEAQTPFSPGSFYRVQFPIGLTGGHSPARWNLAGRFPALGAPIQRLYASFWIRYSAAYQGSSKLVFFSQRDGNNHYLILTNRGDTGYEAVIQNQGINFERVTAPMPDVRQWNFVELLLESGDAGRNNGSGTLWVNGAVLLNKRDFRFFASGAAAAWENLWMDPTYGGPAVTNEWMDIGHVYVSVGTAAETVFLDGFEATTP